ncbi:hypothetical protein BJ138DRAFT_166044 [Hygrophoropsis aurantiaca]|uniref:Uncharacterized protein n=1 Tax=Hygrophoropsis aurantiaca TaxID=72124 RepID=A0ACB8A983_9AGAM|nr:hypothetical protein BJ138DRAFT_166044 [Hygrophoropsis aurantiaca]
MDHTSMISISALAFLCWDLCLTASDEIELVSSKTWKSPVKWLFLIARYTGLASLIANRPFGMGGRNMPLSCEAFLAMQSSLTQVLVTVSELILMIRVHALYNRNRWMTAFLVFLAFIGTADGIVGLIFTLPNAQFDSLCGVADIGSSMTSFTLAFVAIDVILLLLTVFKCVHTFQTTTRDIPVVVLMLRDGTAAFLAIITVLLATSVSMHVGRGKYLPAVTPWFKAVLSCSGYRVIINLQQLSVERKPRTEHPTHGLPVITSHLVIESPSIDVSTDIQ